MKKETIQKLIYDTAYIRTGGSKEELACAEYLKTAAEAMGLTVRLEEFAVPMATVKEAHLFVDGEEVPCKGYLCAGSHCVEAPLYYMPIHNDSYCLSQCKGKIVMIDGYLGYWVYRDLLANGAVGFITYDGHMNYADWDMDHRELRSYVSQGEKIPGVNMNAKTAVQLMSRGARIAKIQLEQDEYEGKSHNVVIDLPGETDEWILCTAHYDSTSLSQGSYDNMSGTIGVLALAEHFRTAPHRYGMRFILCGSEERGLLGSKAYVMAHEGELEKVVLNINIDMIGSIMGKFLSCCTCENEAVHYIKYMGYELGFPVSAYQGVYSSDSTPFADKGVPAISFARSAPGNTATIHNRYDTPALLMAERMEEDIGFITAFADRMANAVYLPIARKIPDNMKDELDKYLARKRRE